MERSNSLVMQNFRFVNSDLHQIIITVEDPSLQIESFVIINLRTWFFDKTNALPCSTGKNLPVKTMSCLRLPTVTIVIYKVLYTSSQAVMASSKVSPNRNHDMCSEQCDEVWVKEPRQKTLVPSLLALSPAFKLSE